MSCVFQEAKVVDADGHLHLELLSTHIDKLDAEVQDIALNIGKKCLTPVGNTHCETAFWYNKCWKTADPKVINHFCFLVSLFNFCRFFSALFLNLKKSPKKGIFL